MAKNEFLRSEMRRARIFAMDAAAEMGITKAQLFWKLSKDLSVEEQREIWLAIDKAAKRRELERQKVIGI